MYFIIKIKIFRNTLLLIRSVKRVGRVVKKIGFGLNRVGQFKFGFTNTCSRPVTITRGVGVRVGDGGELKFHLPVGYVKWNVVRICIRSIICD